MKKGMFTVRETYHRERARALVIHEDRPLGEVARRFTGARVLRAIFVVDAKRRLTGVVTRTDLLNYVKFKLGILDHLARYPPSWSKVIRYLHATKDKDLTHKGSRNAYVRLDDDVAKALHIIIDHDLIEVPVLGDNGIVLGDIGVPDILLKLLVSSKRRGGRL